MKAVACLSAVVIVAGAIASVAENNAVKLRYSWRAGDRFHVLSRLVRQEVREDVKQGKKSKRHEELDQNYLWEILQVNDGQANIKVKFLDSLVRLNQDDKTTAFSDSRFLSEFRPDEPLGDVAEFFKKAEYTFHVDARGHVTKVDGATQLAEQYRQILGRYLKDSKDRANVELLQDALFSEAKVKRTLSDMFIHYPEEAVRVGQSWDEKIGVGAETFDLAFAVRYQLDQAPTGDKPARLSGVGTGQLASKQEGIEYQLSKGEARLQLDAHPRLGFPRGMELAMDSAYDVHETRGGKKSLTERVAVQAKVQCTFVLPALQKPAVAFASGADTLAGMAFTPDGKLAVTGWTRYRSSPRAHQLFVSQHDPATGKRLTSTPVTQASSERLAAVDATGRLLSWCGADQQNSDAVFVLNAQAGKPMTTLSMGATLSPPITAIHIAAGGKHLLTAKHDKEFSVWDLQTKKQHAVTLGKSGEKAVTTVVLALSPDGSRLVETALVPAAGTMEMMQEAAKKSPTQMPTPAQLASLFNDFDKCFHGRLTLRDVASQQELYSQAGDNVGMIVAAAFSPDGKVLATGNASQKLHLWDADKLTLLRTIPDYGGSTLVFSPDGSKIAASHRNGWISVWDVVQGRLLNSIYRAGATTPGEPSVLAFSRDGKTLATTALAYTGAKIEHPIAMLGYGAKRLFASIADSVQSAVPTPPTAEELAQLSPGMEVQLWQLDDPELAAVTVAVAATGAPSAPTSASTAEAGNDESLTSWLWLGVPAALVAAMAAFWLYRRSSSSGSIKGSCRRDDSPVPR